MTPSLIFNCGSQLLEGPIFDESNNKLYFVSILDCLVYCYDPNSKEVLSVKLDSPVSCVFLLDKKKVLVSSKNGFFEIDFNSLQKKFVFQIDIDNLVRYNDGIKDDAGRVIIGTMGYPDVKENIGKVFSYYKGRYKVIINNTTISNGLAFSEDKKFLYFIDTPTKKVARYSYDIKTGDVEFEANVIEFKEDGVPDGMCIDSKGMLWIAEWGGGRISKWNPFNGEKMDEIKLPCSNVTSCCFDNHSNLYITTAKDDLKEDILGGGVFYVELNKI